MCCLQGGDGLRGLLWCPVLGGGSCIPCAWIYGRSCLFFPSDTRVLFYITFPLLIQAVVQHLAVPADSQLWNIFFSLNRKVCLGSWELPGMFLLVGFKSCAEALLSVVLFLAVAREELLPRVFSCASALGCCIHEPNIWGPPFLAFSCVLHCLISNLVAWKPHKKCLCLIDGLGPRCKCQPKVSKWVTAHTHRHLERIFRATWWSHWQPCCATVHRESWGSVTEEGSGCGTNSCNYL